LRALLGKKPFTNFKYEEEGAVLGRMVCFSSGGEYGIDKGALSLIF